MDSLVVRYDQLIKNSRILRQGVEEKCLEFAINQGLCRERWFQAETNLSRINLELEECKVDVSRLELKLSQARDLLAAETGLRKKAEQEREEARLELKIVKDLLSQTVSNSCGQIGETSGRLQIPLSNRSVLAVQSPMRGYQPSPIRRLGGADSTCSILDASELSFDTSQNMQGLITGPLRSHSILERKSSGVEAAVAAEKNEQRLNKSPVLALEAARRIAEEGGRDVEEHTRDSSMEEEEEVQTTTEPLDSTVLSWQFTRGQTLPSSKSTKETSSQYRTTSQDSQTEPSSTSIQSYNSIPRTHPIDRPHQFVQKNNFRSETCGPCHNKIKFGKIYNKCRECRVVSHPECRDRLPTSCVPTLAKTPKRSRSFQTNREANCQDSAKKKANGNLELYEDKGRNAIFPSPRMY